jgi:hypothetical protein
MGSIPLPALDYKNPQIDVVGAQARQLQLRDLQNKLTMFPQQQAMAQAQLENEQAEVQKKQLDLKDDEIWSDSMKEAAQQGPKVGYDKPGSILQNAADIATNKGASFKSIMAHNEALAKLHQTLSITAKDDIETLQKQHENASSLLHGVLERPDEELEDEYNKQIGILKSNPAMAQSSYGLDPATLPEFKDRESLQQEADMLQGYSNVVREHTQQTEAEARSTQAKTAAAKEKREAGNPQPGTVTPAIEFEQANANYRAQLTKRTTLSNELQKNGLSQLDKMFTDPVHGYTQFLAQAQETKSAVAAAKNGNELATSLTPLMTALGVVSFAGIHRINQYDINQSGPQVGSLYRKMNTILDKAGTGAIQPDTARETVEIMDQMINAKHHTLLQGARMVSQNAGLDPNTTAVMDRHGDPVNLGDVAWKGTDQYRYSGTGDRNDEKSWVKVQ